jgi:hypothetical protein
MADSFTCVDTKLQQRVGSFPTVGEAIAAGQTALLLVDDTAWGVVLIRPGRALGSENFDSLIDTNGVTDIPDFFPANPGQVIPSSFRSSFKPLPFRLIKLGELRFVSAGVVTFFPLTVADGIRRADDL